MYNPAFRRELLRTLNRGEATNALKRLAYTGRVANYQAKSEDEMRAVADALSLLANFVIASKHSENAGKRASYRRFRLLFVDLLKLARPVGMLRLGTARARIVACHWLRAAL